MIETLLAWFAAGAILFLIGAMFFASSTALKRDQFRNDPAEAWPPNEAGYAFVCFCFAWACALIALALALYRWWPS